MCLSRSTLVIAPWWAWPFVLLAVGIAYLLALAGLALGAGAQPPRIRDVTIVASVKVRDGLVLATDSMTQIQVADPNTGQINVLKTYANARKLFQIRDSPIGVVTYGLGNLDGRSIEGLVLDFCTTPGAQRDTVQEVATELFSFVHGLFSAQFASLQTGQSPPVLGFIVAGYSAGQAFPEEYEFQLPRDSQPGPVRPTDVFGASWRGIDFPFGRLYKGFDPRLPNALIGLGLDAGQLRPILDALEAAVIYDGMPMQDAVNFAKFILETTIRWSEFIVGPPACGGPLQVATIAADDGLTWLAKPDLRV